MSSADASAPSRSSDRPDSPGRASALKRYLTRKDPVGFIQRVVPLLVIFPLLTMTAPFKAVIELPLMRVDAWLTHHILAILGTATELRDTVVFSPRFSIEVIPGCTGQFTMLILFAMVIAFPAPWKRRLVGLALGFALIFSLNLIRLVTLFLIGRSFPFLFEDVHLFVWQAITITVALVFWYGWARRSLRDVDASGAAAEAPA